MRATALAVFALLLIGASGASAQDGNSAATVTTQDVGFTPATVQSAVNIRNRPDSRNSDVIGAL